MEKSKVEDQKVGKVFLAFAGICILALPLIVLSAFSTELEPMAAAGPDTPTRNFDERGAAIFERYSQISAVYLEGASSERTLSEYYSRRQYLGAPPYIPHEVEKNDETSRTCLTCHAQGGWTQELKRNTPITPHPEYAACRQCHVTLTEEKRLFVANDWESLAPPRLGRSYLPGAPPPIPHDLQMRGDCIACHVGPGTVAAIRVEHPMRGDCRQCHVPDAVEGLFQR